MSIKRLFFALPIHAPWPLLPASGRCIASEMRHLTIAFLGNVDDDALINHLKNVPLPNFKVGFSGYFDQCLFLPEKDPHVIAWNGVFEEKNAWEAYAIQLNGWLKDRGYNAELKLPWLPHATLARAPFDASAWKSHFVKIPFYVSGLGLYESLPNLNYQTLWKHPFVLPFQEIDHTADMAFMIRGDSFKDLFWNASSALAFHHPALLNFKLPPPTQESELVPILNKVLALTDAAVGCPFKAVSYHGEIKKKQDFYEWEMIVDV